MPELPPFFLRRILYLFFLIIDIHAATIEEQIGWLIFDILICIMFAVSVLFPGKLGDIVYKRLFKRNDK